MTSASFKSPAQVEKVQHEEGPIELHPVYRDIGKRGGQPGLPVGFLPDVAQMFLDTLAVDPFVFDFCQVHLPAALDFSNEAHSVEVIVGKWLWGTKGVAKGADVSGRN